MTRPKLAMTTVNDLPDAVGPPWRDFLERFEPLRPDLYRYCRYLAHSPWEADDLVQETLMRSFVALACLRG
jgi:RNA polymerase sigma-70 factor (ECF subfamily)